MTSKKYKVKECHNCGTTYLPDSPSQKGCNITCSKELRYNSRVEYLKEYNKLNSDRIKSLKLLSKYGITLSEYQTTLDLQGGKCAICNEGETARSNAGYVKNLAVDHCHTTGEVRGLLCNRCNVGIGYLNDDVVRLHSAIKYLNKEKL
jgi:hypothetical protein